MKSSLRKIIIGTGAIIVLTVVLLVMSVEYSGRRGLLQPSFSQGGASGRNFSLVFDKDLLYRVKPHGRYDINGQGYRDFHDFRAQKPAGKKRILFLGDSFVMGMNVISTHTIPKELEKVLGDGYEVFNLGVHGYGPDQSLAQLEKDGIGYAPDLVILNICAQNDYRDLEKNRLFAVDTGSGKLKRATRNALSGVIPSSHGAFLCQYLLWKYGLLSADYAGLFYTLFVDSYDIAPLHDPASGQFGSNVVLMRGIMRQFGQELSSRGIPLLVTVMPSYDNVVNDEMLRKSGIAKERYFFLEDTTAEICRQEGLSCINLHSLFSGSQNPALIYDPADQHLSDFGTRLVAEIISKELLRSGALSGSR